MEIRVLRYFLMVAQEENITKAAEKLHLTQPTLSRQLAQLEAELGVPLLVRENRKISLSQQGLLLRRRASEIVELADKAAAECREEEFGGEIAIGSAVATAANLLPALMGSFHEKYPKVRYDLTTGNADQVRESMDRGLVDIGIFLGVMNEEKYHVLPLPFQERWGLLLPRNHPLARMEGIRPQDLRGIPLCLSKRLSTQQDLFQWLGEDTQWLQVFSTHDLLSNSVTLVEANLACAVTVEGAALPYENERLCFRPLSPRCTMSSSIAWKRGQHFTPTVERFIQHVQCFLSMEKSLK
ncbi:MAG: LysR family transcriptional regulator [Oscillospiraceae bacterium]